MKYENFWHRQDKQTDRRTDRQTELVTEDLPTRRAGPKTRTKGYQVALECSLM